jgi:hypothetical protein
MNNLAEKRESVMGLKDVMRGAPQKEASPSKSKTPVLNVSQDVQKMAMDVYEAKVNLDTAENTFKRVSETLVNAVAPMRIDLCQREMVTSVKVPAGSHLVGVVWSSNYKKIPNTQEAELIKILGEKDYNQSFYSKFEIIAEDKTEDELYNLFCMLAPNGGTTDDDVRIGQERFMAYFKVKETIRPTEVFVRNHIFMSEEKRAELELCGVQQYLPSIRTR